MSKFKIGDIVKTDPKYGGYLSLGQDRVYGKVLSVRISHNGRIVYKVESEQRYCGYMSLIEDKLTLVTPKSLKYRIL